MTHPRPSGCNVSPSATDRGTGTDFPLRRTPARRQLAMVWAYGALMGCVLVAGAAWLIDRLKQDAERQGRETVLATADLAQKEWMLTLQSPRPGMTPGEEWHGLEARLERLTGLDLVLAYRDGTLAWPTGDSETDAVSETLARTLPAGAFSGAVAWSGPDGGYVVTARNLSPPSAQSGHVLIAAGRIDRLMAAHYGQRARIAAGTLGMGILLFGLTALLAAYLRNKLHYEAELSDRTRLLEEAKEIAGLGTWTLDLENDRLDTCRHMQRIYDTDESSHPRTMAEWIRRFLPVEEQAAFLALRQSRFGGVPFDREHRVLTVGGQERWIRTIARPELDTRGTAVRYRGVTLDITAARRAMIDLAAKTSQLVEAQRIGRMGSWYWNVITDEVVFSAQHRAMYELPADEPSCTMQAWARRNCQGDELVTALQRLDAARAGTPIDEVRRVVTGSGRQMWVHAIAHPQYDAQGRVVAVQGISRDITIDKIHEMELAEAARRVAEAQRIGKIGHFYWDLASDRIEVFGEFDAVAGTRAATRFRTMTEWVQHFCHPDDRAAAVDGIASRDPDYRVYRRTRGDDGHYRWIECFGELVRDDAGTPAGYRGVVRDVHEAKSLELKLADSERRFRLIAHNMHDIVSVHDANGKARYVSPSFSREIGYANAATLARRLLHPADRRATLARFGAVARGRDATATGTFRLRHRDGHYLWFESHFIAVLGDVGIQVQVVSRNVTRRQAAELALAARTTELARINRRLEDEVRRRLALERNVLLTIEMELSRVGLELHDQLGQDLTGISLMAKSLQKRLGGSQPAEAENASKISALVNDTIRHTRMISHGLSPYIWGSAGLAAALAQLAADINALGVVEVSTRLGSGVDIRDELAARSLYRIAQESANNALKHSHAQRIRIGLAVRGRGVELTVSDDGVGCVDNLEQARADGSRFHSIRHRCSVIGASLAIRHPRKGGTTVTVLWSPPEGNAGDTPQPTLEESA